MDFRVWFCFEYKYSWKIKCYIALWKYLEILWKSLKHSLLKVIIINTGLHLPVLTWKPKWIMTNAPQLVLPYYGKSESEVKLLSCVWLFVTLWTVAHQAPPSMGFSRQEYWSGLPFPSPGDLPDPGIEPRSPALQADALTSEPPGKPIYYGKD